MIWASVGQYGFIFSVPTIHIADQVGKTLAPVFELGKNLHDKDTKCTVKVKASLAKVKHQLAER